MADPDGPAPGESAEDYHRFCVYRDLGPRRSLAEAARLLGLSLSRMKQLSASHGWERRVLFRDIGRRRQQRERKLEAIREGRAALLREAVDWQQLARSEFAHLLRRGESGELELVRDLTAREALRLWQVGWQVERELLGYGPAGGHDADACDVAEIGRLVNIVVEEVIAYFTSRGVAEDARSSLIIAFADFVTAVERAGGAKDPAIPPADGRGSRGALSEAHILP